MRKDRLFATLLLAAPFLTAGCMLKTERSVTTTEEPSVIHHHEVVDRPPMPQPRVEVRPMPPAPTYRWVEGHYEWDGASWNWQPGYWAP